MISEFLFIPIGIIVGTLSGFYGIGGGVVLMPILLLSGFSPAIAVPTSLMFTFGTSLSGAITHSKMKNVNWRTAVMIGSAGAVSAQLSKLIVIHISGSYDWLLNIWFTILLCYFAWKLYQKDKKGKDEQEKDKKRLIENAYIAPIIIGIIIGFLAALLGIGGGFITIPLLISWLNFDPRKAVGTSLAAIIITSAGGIIGYSSQMDLNYLLGFCLIIGAFIGSPFGARMTARYETYEMTQRLWTLYLFVIASVVVDLFAVFTWHFLQWISLAILLTFVGYMLFDFYRHHLQARTESSV